MNIRKTKTDDLERVMDIYSYAREKMAQTGNPNQWGPTNWPPEKLIREDIAAGRSYVCIMEGGEEQVVGTFCYMFGRNVEPAYDVIEGEWSKADSYGVIHRLAGQGAKGVGDFCIDWALAQSGYLRIDTHPDNKIMQHLFAKHGFKKCGVIYVQEDCFPRFAYDKIN